MTDRTPDLAAETRTFVLFLAGNNARLNRSLFRGFVSQPSHRHLFWFAQDRGPTPALEGTGLEWLASVHGQAPQSGSMVLLPPGEPWELNEDGELLCDAEGEGDKHLASLARHHGAQLVVVLLGTEFPGCEVGLHAAHRAGALIAGCGVRQSSRGVGTEMPWPHVHLATTDFGSALTELLGRWSAPKPEGTSFEGLVLVAQKSLDLDLSALPPKTVQTCVDRRARLAASSDTQAYLAGISSSQPERARLLTDIYAPRGGRFRSHEHCRALSETLRAELRSRGSEKRELRIWIPSDRPLEEAFGTLACLACLPAEGLEAQPLSRARDYITGPHRHAVHTGTPHQVRAELLEGLPKQCIGELFTQQGKNLRPSPELDEQLIVAGHELTLDPPYLELDLVVCRGVLSRLSESARRAALERIVRSLKPGGLLLVDPGEAECVVHDQFEPSRPEVGLHTRLAGRELPRPLKPTEQSLAKGLRGRVLERICHTLATDGGAACFLLGATGIVLESFGETARFTTLPAGRADLRLTSLLRAELTLPLRSLLHQLESGADGPIAQRVPMDGDSDWIELRAERLDDGSSPRMLVRLRAAVTPSEPVPIFELQGETRRHLAGLEDELLDRETEVRELRSRLSETDVYMRDEHLRSEDTGVRISSLERELQSVQSERNVRLGELTTLRRDIENLIQATQVQTLFFDQELYLRLFTQAVADAFDISDSDVGRHISELHGLPSGLPIEELGRSVISSGTARERRVRGPQERMLQLRAQPYRDARGRPEGVVVTMLDVSEVHHSQNSLAQSEEIFRQLTGHIEEVFYLRSVDGRDWIYISPKSEKLWDRTPAQLYRNGLAWLDCVHAGDRQRVEESFLPQIGTQEIEVEYRVVLGGGRVRWIRERAFPIRDDSGLVVRVAGVAEDVTDRKEKEEALRALTLELEAQANNDPLTGLLNRRGLEKTLVGDLDRARREGAQVVSILVDCDDFKHINDTFGHAVGDVVLNALGKRMLQVLRPSDTLARIGGDEFLMLLYDVRVAEAIQIAERLRLVISDSPLRSGEKQLCVTASLGVTIVPPHTASVEEIIARSHNSLARSKRGGKNRVSEGHEKVSDKPTELDREPTFLTRLTSEDCIIPVAQAIIDLSTEKIVGYELLSRGPIGPFQNPYDLFRLAMEHNMLTLVDLKCLRASVQWARESGAEGDLHVNLFPSTLIDTPIENLAPLLASGDQSSRFCVEISEQQFIGNPAYLKDAVVALKARGIEVAIDDVGFGRSSLESLIVLEPNTIKIDRTFVSGVSDDRSKRRSLERLVRVAQSLGSEVIAEGVETAEELDLVRKLGVRCAQGYLWGKPAHSFPIGQGVRV